MKTSLQDILSLPTAQRRTGTAKKYVFVDDDHVYKGPYSTCDDKYVLKAKNSSVALRYLESLAGVAPERSSHLPIKKTLDFDGKVFLVYDNLGTPVSPKDVEVVDTMIDKQVPVIKRSTFVYRVSELEKTGKMSDRAKVDALQHLYFRFLLGIGDSGTHNILLTKDGRIVGIDLEESKKLVHPATALDALFKKSSKLQREMYGSHVRTIRRLKDLTIAEESYLESLGFDRCKERVVIFNRLVS